MNRIPLFLAGLVASCLLAYLAIAFFLWSLDAGTWGTDGRFLAMFMATVLTGACGLALFEVGSPFMRRRTRK